MIELTGSPKQLRWAATVYQNFQEQFGIDSLPTVQDAAWWIANRNCTLVELQEQALIYRNERARSTPFTATYPRYSKAQALDALASLPGVLAILDTETTGLAKKGEVCELSIVEYPSRLILFDSLIMPQDFNEKQAKKAMEVNGITYEELAAAPTLLDVWSKVLPVLTSYHLVVFNADFDIPMIRYSARKWGITVPSLSATCLMKLAAAYIQSDYYLSLEEICSVFNVDRSLYGITHRALADTLATCDILHRLNSERDDK